MIIQIIDPAINFTDIKLKELYEKMKKTKQDPHLRYFSRVTINNENVAFFTHSLPDGNENVSFISEESSYLFATYGRLTGGTLTRRKGKVIIDENGILAKMQPIVLRDFILTNDVVKWGLYHGENFLIKKKKFE